MAERSTNLLISTSLLSGKKILLFDPEGGRMFIVIDIPDKSTPKVVACENFSTYDRLRGREKGWNEFFYKHVTPSGSRLLVFL